MIEANTSARTVPSLTRVVIGPLVLAAALGATAVACGTTDEASRETLPPLITTTSSTAPVVTDPNEGKTLFYEIKSGEGLGQIAQAFGVPLQSIIDLNNIENPDNVPAGLIIQIPTDEVVVDELPEITTTTEA